jgi:lysophospholipase L1-like esterase
MRRCSRSIKVRSVCALGAASSVALAILRFTTCTVLAAPGSASAPVPRSDTNSLIAHKQLLEKARKGGIDVYFVGDSITRRWGAIDPQYHLLFENWRTNFFGWNAANFGWGGDRIENIIWRLQNGEIDGVNPKVIVALAGINNVGNQPLSPEKVEDIAGGLKSLVAVCQAKAPKATIILTAIFPRNDNLAVVPAIREINERMMHWVDGKRVRYLDINDQIADASGRLLPGMVNADQLHPRVKAYQIWADALKPVFTDLLGPPGSTDHAPPPTGDPSAVRTSHVN